MQTLTNRGLVHPQINRTISSQSVLSDEQDQDGMVLSGPQPETECDPKSRGKMAKGGKGEVSAPKTRSTSLLGHRRVARRDSEHSTSDLTATTLSSSSSFSCSIAEDAASSLEKGEMKADTNVEPSTPKSEFEANEQHDQDMKMMDVLEEEVEMQEEKNTVPALPEGWRACSLIPSLPPLPPLEEIRAHRLLYRGVTDESNWLLPDRLMVGAYPGSVDSELHDRQISSVLSTGIRTFVCLQREYDGNATRRQWRSGQRIRPYLNDAITMLRRGVIAAPSREQSGPVSRPLAAPAIPSSPSTSSASHSSSSQSADVRFVHCPIVDCDTTSDQIIVELATNLLRRLDVGEKIYLHCWGGHGRAGTVASILLGLLYGMDGPTAMEWVQELHDCRRYHLSTPSPQTNKQRAQVTRILRRFYAEKTP